MLLREWLLHGHLQDRVGIPLLYEQGLEREEAEQVAIDEWMAASPVYSVRMQELLGFRGSTVEVILKNIQLDIGAPPQFMDFRMKVIDDDHGEFWLDHCGALMDVEPMGDEWVRGMCHTIEDPTFDATALATNPKAAVRPIHRPPRVPDRPPPALPLDGDRRPRPRDAGAPPEPGGRGTVARGAGARRAARGRRRSRRAGRLRRSV